MWATFDVNLISPQHKQGANGEWASWYLEPCRGSGKNSLSYAVYDENEATDCAGTKTCGFRWTFMNNDLALTH